jgi:hypothetical protein
LQLATAAVHDVFKQRTEAIKKISLWWVLSMELTDDA